MKVVICGAGIAGLTLAWLLGREGWEVLIVERSPALREAGYMIDFWSSGYDAAERMGLLPRLQKVAYDIPEIVYVDEEGRRSAALNYQLFQKLQWGRLLSFMRGDLERILYDDLPSSVVIRFDVTAAAVEQDGSDVEVGLSDGTRERADLLVGADGVHSRVRRLLFGEEKQFLRDLGYQTAAYIFRDDRLRERLNGEFRLLSVPGRQAGFYPIRDGAVASFFVHETEKTSLPERPCDELRAVYGDLGWLLPQALGACDSSDVYYDQVAQVELPEWRRGRVALLGDACQAVSLLAGQGASLAMGAAYVLTQELDRDDDVDAALARYEARLKPAVEKKQAAGRKTAGWIVPSTPLRIASRNVALRLSTLPGLSWLLRPVLSAGSESVVE